MKFSLFRKPKKEPEPEKTAAPQEEAKQETAVSAEAQQPETAPSQPEPVSEPAPQTATPAPASPQEPVSQTMKVEQMQEPVEPQTKTYLKAMPLKELSDIENVKEEVKNGNIIILRVTPLANKNIEDVKTAVNQLYDFAEASGGDIARLGEERVVICPKNVRIWREKTAAQTETPPTSAPTAA